MFSSAITGGLDGARPGIRLLRAGLVLLAFLAGCQQPRLSAATPQIGMNLSGISYYSPEQPFIDRVRSAGGWSSDKGEMKPDQLDANGYPLALPAGAHRVYIMVGFDPPALKTPHRYVILYKGKGDFGFDGAGVVGGGSGRLVIDVQKDQVQFSFAPSGPDTMLRDFHVVRLDQEALFKAGEIFNPAFLEKAKTWRTLRMMEWLGTNASLPADWTGRAKVTDLTWASPKGVPIEIIARLANQAGTDLWINVPTLADDTYVRDMLTLLKGELDPRRTLQVEYSNEVWNWAFPAAHIAQTNGNTLWGTDANHDGKVDNNDPKENYGPGWVTWYGYRSAQVAKVARSVFQGEDRKRLRTIISTQTEWLEQQKAVFDGVARAKLGPVSSLFDDYAITTYFGRDMGGIKEGRDLALLLSWARGGEPGMAAAFDHLRTGSGKIAWSNPLSDLPKVYAYQSQVAVTNKMRLVAYEGGAHLTLDNAPPATHAELLDFLKRLMNDPRMGELYTQMIRDFGAAGGAELTAFNDIGGAGTWGYWGVLDNIYQTSSPRYDALKAAQQRAVAAAPPTAP